MNLRSFAKRFVFVLIVLVLLLPGVALVQAQEQPAATVVETITFETNTPQPPATEAVVTAEVTPVPVVTEVVVTPVVDPPAEPPAPEPGISESALISVVQTLVLGIVALAFVLIVITIAHGLLQGKSVHELARSQPVQAGLTVAATAATLTPDTTDDDWIAARAKQLGWEVTNADGVITLKKVDIPPIIPASG